MTIKTISIAAALTAVACSATTETEEDVARGPIGKADLVGSCVDSGCDGPSVTGNCWCDELCTYFGDCCEDKAAVCDVVHCGGFASIPCPDGLECVDDPSDDCDPAHGGADCGGICVEPTVQHCGGFAGLACPSEDQYCNYTDACGAADQLGDCVERPSFCVEIFNPVCGCDGHTYGNPCKAASAGVSVASLGECAAPAPAGDSCVDACGGPSSDGSCWCDNLCTGYGDCCADYGSACSG